MYFYAAIATTFYLFDTLKCQQLARTYAKITTKSHFIHQFRLSSNHIDHCYTTLYNHYKEKKQKISLIQNLGTRCRHLVSKTLFVSIHNFVKCKIIEDIYWFFCQPKSWNKQQEFDGHSLYLLVKTTRNTTNSAELWVIAI